METLEKKPVLSPETDGAIDYGKHWAALRGNQVLNTVSMRVPGDLPKESFETYREHIVAALNLLGSVRSGSLFEYKGDMYFLPRPTSHQNRSKSKPKKVIEPIKLYNPSRKGA